MYMNFRFLPFLLLALGSAPAFADAGKFKGEVDFLASIPNSLPDQSLVARGDLTGDGLEDLALVVVSGKEWTDRNTQLFVLVKDKAGEFSVAESSVQAPVVGVGCCWVEMLEVTNGSIYLQNNAKTACAIEAAVHQFKLYRGEWRLIGLKISNFEHCDEPQVSKIQDINVLTGKVIHSHQLDDCPPRTWTTHFAPKILMLNDYDFFNGFGAPGT